MLSRNKLDTLFLDRDGVLNRKIDDGYVTNLEEIEILPGIPEFLSLAEKKFARIVVITNQRCVGREIITRDELEKINQKINELTGNRIAHFFYCPHLDEDHCPCRKPKNGLFLQATEKYPIDLKASWMVGDSETDLVPAKGLGLKTVFISNKESRFADVRVKDTQELLASFNLLA
ncbi:D-glycero-alpha-D-manno-heptose-1,7-bisphosphate 7-phosphatase [Rufibacter latericius]|uniref:D,D-heptose 1,7-bisphosphate phosphatase n=1 Tax=Rufibacter latericius TaxID=2487040 RepID=A0A3M9MUL9_9BACT|nr:HAD family hydrolase [Rufibacter latericius]RNI29221.1 HAD family hydrolase [Rufibacter latericius]